MKLDFSKALEKLAKEIVKDMQDKVPVDLGSLKRSITFKVTPDEITFDMLEYGMAVHYGSRPHFPPVKAIRGWAKRKGINPYALQKSIGKKGTAPHPFMDEFLTFSAEYMKIFQDESSKELEDYVYNKLKKLKK
jgi:hypothetical protein